MKKLLNRLGFWNVLLVGSGLFILTSCGNGELTKGSAESALEEKVLKLQENSQYVSLPTGYFEVSNKDIATLQKLADAGLITCKVETITRVVKYYYSVRNYEHHFATVSLTPEGQKYIIEPCMEIVDKDMINKQEGKAKKAKKEITYTTSDSIRIADSIAAVEAAEAEAAVANMDNNVSETEELSAYETAKRKSNQINVYVLSHQNKIVKVRDIYCPEEMLKVGKATCNYIYENYKVTPFGEIVNGVQEGERHENKASFIKYIDRGWCVD